MQQNDSTSLAHFTSYEVLSVIDLNPTNDLNIKKNYLLWLVTTTYYIWL